MWYYFGVLMNLIHMVHFQVVDSNVIPPSNWNWCATSFKLWSNDPNIGFVSNAKKIKSSYWRESAPYLEHLATCQNGHITCFQCCTKIEKKCPSCRLIIGDIRCLAIERVIESIKVSCRNKPYGCKETVLYMKKQKHEKSCKYAPFRCPISVCDFEGTSPQLCLHFSCQHSSSAQCFKYNNPFTVNLDVMKPYHLLQEEEDARLFVLSNQCEILGNAISLACLGSRSYNIGFGYELKARQQGCSLKLKSETEFVKDHQEAAGVTGFLVVPLDSYSGKLELEILIQKKDYAWRP